MKDTIYFQTKQFSEIKEADNNEVIIEGFASTKDMDRYQDIVKPSAFKNAIDGYMKNPVMLLQHNQDKPIGLFTEASITSKGLKVKGTITNDLDNVKENVRNGVLKGFSIGFIVKGWAFKEVDGVEIREITDLELLEISVVAVPANPFTLFQAVKKYFTTINEKDMDKSKKIEEEILDEAQIKGAEDAEVEDNNEEVVEEKTNEDDKEEQKEVIEENIEEKKEVEEEKEEVAEEDATHELHNETVSDDSEKSDENSDENTETDEEEATDEAAENADEEEAETTDEDNSGEADEVDLKSLVADLVEIVEKQNDKINNLENTISGVSVRKGLATIGTQTKEKKDSGNAVWLKAFKEAKQRV